MVLIGERFGDQVAQMLGAAEQRTERIRRRVSEKRKPQRRRWAWAPKIRRLGASTLPYPDYLLQRRQPRFDGRAVDRLCVNPDQRLGAARPQQHPAAVLEVELEAVVGANALDAHAGDLLRFVLLERLENPLAVRVIRLADKVDVMPRVSVGSDAALEVGEDRGERFACLDDHVGEQQAHQDSVAFGNMTTD